MTTTFTLDATPQFPVGTTLKAYPGYEQSIKDSEPTGAIQATATVGSTGVATFTGLTSDTSYWAAASVSGHWRWKRFRTGSLRTLSVTDPEGDNLATFDADGEVTGVLSLKPPTTYMQYVNADTGDDTKDGLSWGSAKQTLAAAVTALPNGGNVRLAPAAAEYNVTSTLSLAGHTIECVGRAPGGTHGLAVVRHKFNGDLFLVTDAKGCQLRNLLLYQDDTTAYTGAAIKVLSTVADIAGNVQLENCIVSGGDGWERNVIIDGLAQPDFGARKIQFTHCQFFGCYTAGESIVIKRGVHVHFTACFQDQAPTLTNQGVRVEDAGSTDVQFANFRLIGDFYTEAAGDGTLVGHVTGNVTCAVGSQNNYFVGRVGGTFTDSSVGKNNRQIASLAGTNTWQNHQSFEGSVSGKADGTGLTLAGGASAVAGYVKLNNRASVGVTRVEPEAGALHVQQGVLLTKRATTVPVPASGFGQLAVVDNGSGKHQLVIQFPTGSVQVIATEP